MTDARRICRRTPAWFRPKSNGRGFTPSSWPGWMLTVTLNLAEIATGRLSPARGGRITAAALGAAEAGAYFLFVSCAGGRTIWNWFFDFGDR